MYRSVCIFVLVSLSASTQFLTTARELDDNERQCATNLNIDPSLVVDGNFYILNSGVVPQEIALCYGPCLMLKRGEVHSNGTLHIENMKKTLPRDLVDPEKSVEHWEKCIKERGGKMFCERANQALECIVEEIVERESSGRAVTNAARWNLTYDKNITDVF